MLFCPKEMSWWVFPGGQGQLPISNLTREAAIKLATFDVSLGNLRKGAAGMDRDGLGGWDEDKKAPHLHLFKNAIRPGSFDEASNLASPFARLGPTLRPNVPSSLPPALLPSSKFDDDTEMESPRPSLTVNSDDTPTVTSSPSDPPTPSFPTPVAFSDLPALIEPDNLYISANDSTWVVIPRRPAQLGVLNPETVAAFSKSRSVNPPVGSPDGIDAAWTVILS